MKKYLQTTIVNNSTKNVPISEFRSNMSKFVDECEQSGTGFSIIRNSRPCVFIINTDEYAKYDKWKKENFWNEVAEAEQELEEGKGEIFDSAEDFLKDLAT